MNILELRLGNILKTESGCFVSVSSLSELGINHNKKTNYWYSINKYFPVKITEEILLNCGFKIGQNDDPELIDKIFNNEQGALITLKDESFLYHHSSLWNCEINIEFLHQLQNLVFYFTGKDLEILSL